MSTKSPYKPSDDPIKEIRALLECRHSDWRDKAIRVYLDQLEDKKGKKMSAGNQVEAIELARAEGGGLTAIVFEAEPQERDEGEPRFELRFKSDETGQLQEGTKSRQYVSVSIGGLAALQTAAEAMSAFIQQVELRA